MARLSLSLVFLAFLPALPPDPAAAQVEPRRCGVLDGPGCNPYQCSILDGPGCLAEPPPGFGGNLQLTLTTRAIAEAKKPDGKLNTIRDLFTALRGCWTPPAAENSASGMQMSLRFALNREGNLIGEPHVTYATREVSQATRDLYRDAFTKSLQGCMPLQLTRGFAGALAGRPIFVRVIDNRNGVTGARPRT